MNIIMRVVHVFIAYPTCCLSFSNRLSFRCWYCCRYVSIFAILSQTCCWCLASSATLASFSNLISAIRSSRGFCSSSFISSRCKNRRNIQLCLEASRRQTVSEPEKCQAGGDEAYTALFHYWGNTRIQSIMDSTKKLPYETSSHQQTMKHAVNHNIAYCFLRFGVDRCQHTKILETCNIAVRVGTI